MHPAPGESDPLGFNPDEFTGYLNQIRANNPSLAEISDRRLLADYLEKERDKLQEQGVDPADITNKRLEELDKAHDHYIGDHDPYAEDTGSLERLIGSSTPSIGAVATKAAGVGQPDSQLSGVSSIEQLPKSELPPDTKAA